MICLHPEPQNRAVVNEIDRNKLQIRTNSHKGTGTKNAEKLNNFEKFERKKVKFQPCFEPKHLLMTGQMP